jgi:hypothetical protein
MNIPYEQVELIDQLNQGWPTFLVKGQNKCKKDFRWNFLFRNQYPTNVSVTIIKHFLISKKRLEGHFQKTLRAKKCPREVVWPPLN